MNYSDFNPYLIRERNEEIGREVRALRLEGRLRRGHRQQTDLRLVTFALRSTMPLLRRVGLAAR